MGLILRWARGQLSNRETDEVNKIITFSLQKEIKCKYHMYFFKAKKKFHNLINFLAILLCFKGDFRFL